MKKLLLSAAIILGSLSTFTATAKTINPIVKAIVIEEYTEIKVGELPAAITDAFKAAYPEGVINKAFVSETKEYKLEVKVGEKEGFLYSDEKGNWIQK